VNVGLAQAAAETRALNGRRDHYGSVSFKQGHRLGWRDGLTYAGTSWNTITPAQQADHRQECRWGCILDADYRLFGECRGCGGQTEAIGPDELSTCCDAPTVTGPED